MLGTGGITALAPRVTVSAPPDGATNVAIDAANIAVTFSEPVMPLGGTASLTVVCSAPCVSPAGSVALDASGTIATFTPAGPLAPLTEYTGTVTGARSVATGLALAASHTWRFTTGPAPEATRPRVTVTDPATTSPGPTPAVPSNRAIVATFTEDMLAASITPASFTVTCAAPCISPAGTVSYVAGNRTAIFTPAAELTIGATYTATLSTTVTDLAGNALSGNQAPLPAASSYVWTFTTVAAVPPASLSVAATRPLIGGSGVCPGASVNATFDAPAGVRMDPSTVTGTTFVLTGPGTTPVITRSVVLDAATGRIASFTPENPLVDGVAYLARIIGGTNGVRDLSIPANTLSADYTWNFTAGPAGGAACILPPPLAAAERYGVFGGSAGMTNTGLDTVINGDIGTTATGTSSITGFHDAAGDIYTESIGANVGAVNGRIYSCTNSTTGPNSTRPSAPNCASATQARLDAEAAYLALAGTPSAVAPGANLASRTLAPGAYSAPGGSFLIEGGDLTLDAQGDPNAVWIFKMAATLTVGGPGASAPQSIILAGGAQPKNVFWQVGTSATINAGGGGRMVGTIIANSGVTFSTAGNAAITTLDGRAISLISSVTMVNTVINVPAP